MSVRSARANLNGLEAWILIASGGASITRATGPHSDDYSVSATGTGDYVLTLNPFRGPIGEAYAVASTQTISTFASLTALTYTNDSLAITIKVENDASTATDAAVMVHVYAE